MRLCPWSLALASSIPVLGLESVCPRKGCPWPWPWPRVFFCVLGLGLGLEPCVLDSTSVSYYNRNNYGQTPKIYHYSVNFDSVGLVPILLLLCWIAQCTCKLLVNCSKSTASRLLVFILGQHQQMVTVLTVHLCSAN